MYPVVTSINRPLGCAYLCPADSLEQMQVLKGLHVLLESDLEALKTLCPTLLQTAVSMRDTVFKRWTIDLFHFSISSNRLSLDIRTQRMSSLSKAQARRSNVFAVALQCA